MSDTFEINKGDTLPALIATLRDGAGNAKNLTGTTVAFFMRDPASGTFKINGTAASLLDADNGRVKYNWSSTDTNTAQAYAAYFKVTWPGGATENYPTDYQMVVDVVDPAAVLSASLAYADLDDLRDFGVTSQMADDEEARAVLLMSSRFVDDYCGVESGWFGAPTTSTKTFYDVRLPSVPLPRPFSAITAVTADNRVIASTAYQITGYGLFLGITGYLDVDGFPRRTWTPLPMAIASGYPYGSTVAVTATWGYSSVPLPIRRATTILAARAVQDTALNQIPGAALRSITIEGYTRTFAAPYELVPNSTGSYEVDLLLKGYRKDLCNVA